MQRILTVGGRITERLVSRLTRLDLTYNHFMQKDLVTNDLFFCAVDFGGLVEDRFFQFVPDSDSLLLSLKIALKAAEDA